MTNIIERGLPSTYTRVLLNGKEANLKNSDLYFSTLPSCRFIRIRDKEYPFLPKLGSIYTHFNLSPAFHVPGLVYILPRIIEAGYFDGKKEVLPLILLNDSYIAECVGFENFRAYTDLKDQDFEFAARNIRNVEDLKKVIVARYSQSMPTLSEDEILEKGVSITTLKIVGIFSDHHNYSASTPIDSK